VARAGSYIAHHVVHFYCDNIFVEIHENKKAPNKIESQFQVTSSENGIPSQLTSSIIGRSVIQHSGKWHTDVNSEGSEGGSL
jgi:hypothetical protein